MNIQKHMTDTQVLQELGTRLAAERLAQFADYLDSTKKR